MRRHLSFFWPVYVMAFVLVAVAGESWRESYPTWTTAAQRCIAGVCLP